jgi:ubiquinone/menaquinone biosynthesis C-methylase UbiE
MTNRIMVTDTFDLECYESSNIKKYRTDSWIYRKHIKAFQALLFELLDRSDPRSVLDAGCGEGFVTKYIERRDPSLEVTGIDIDEEAIAYARRVVDVDAMLHVGDLYELPFSDASFDTVVCSEVLEHLEHPHQAMDELTRVARSHVLLTVPREPYFRWINSLGQWLGICPAPGHSQFWDHGSFRQFVGRHLEEPSFHTKHVYQLALGKV